jgi:iron complex transport system substrate-binding protein
MTGKRNGPGEPGGPRPPRICSLLPSATEIVAMLGMADCLVGVSAECDWPGSVRGLPVVSASRIDTHALPARQIDDAVRRAIASGHSLYAVDAALIERLDPDLILTQDLCAVCAVSSGELSALGTVQAETITADASSIAGIGACVLKLAGRLGVPERGREVAGAMNARIGQIRDRVRGLPRRAVFVCEWPDPPFAAGHWVPEMVEAAGGTPVLGRAGEPSFPTTWDTVRRARPELVVLAPCGFGAERTARTAQVPPLGCPVVAVDANSYFSRPSPRIADGVAQLGHLIHPEAVPDPGLPAITIG